MSVIKFIHSTIKTLCLAFLSITHTFNYLNYISFMLIIIRDEEKKNISTNLYIILFFIIYDISKFFTNSITLRINRFIGDYAYYSISICILSVINLYLYLIIYHNILIFLYHYYIIGENFITKREISRFFKKSTFSFFISFFSSFSNY